MHFICKTLYLYFIVFDCFFVLLQLIIYLLPREILFYLIYGHSFSNINSFALSIVELSKEAR